MDMDMDMGTSSSTATMNMATTTATGMGSTSTMPDSSSDSMSGMDMSSMSMAEMSMGFFTSFTTALYSNSWTPTNKGQYAGTCIFLITLAIIHRFLLALKPILEQNLWVDIPQHSRPPQIRTDSGEGGVIIEKDVAVQSSDSSVTRELLRRWSNWKINPAGSRAIYEVILAGIGYLLMLAVMTMNVGYFLSVLGGIWLGTFILGGLAAENGWSHDH